MFVQFWAVGATVPTLIPMTSQDISAHLLVDWVPWLPTSASASLMGWPSHLIELVRYDGIDVLALRADAGRTERQWKGMLSWMLGIAGTRHILNKEQYRWIAPLSAFYPDAVLPVSYNPMPTAYPRTSIVAERAPRNSSHLRPDYLALRLDGRSYEWAVVEAKGNHKSLEYLADCPVEWYKQARNVLLKVHGYPITSLRNLVIATRVNPNAANPLTRRVQVRAWNSTEDSIYSGIPLDAAVDIVAAHLYGFFRNIGLHANAHAMALSMEIRSEVSLSAAREFPSRQRDAIERAEFELESRTRLDDQQASGRHSTVVSVITDSGPVEFDIAEPLITLSRNLKSAVDYDHAAEGLLEAESQLDGWERQIRRGTIEDVVLPFGVRVRLPAEFGQVF